jgi:hypothetical protein
MHMIMKASASKLNISIACKTFIKQIGCRSVNWIYLPQDRSQG